MYEGSVTLLLESIVQRSNQYGVEIKAMELENKQRERQDKALAYGPETFWEYAQKFEGLVKEVAELKITVRSYKEGA